jgi:Transglycosylase SLT domain
MHRTLIKKLLWLTFYSLPLLAFAANGTGRGAEVASLQNVQNSALPFKVTIYKSHPWQLAGLTNPPKLRSYNPTAQEVKAYIQRQARVFGVNPSVALWIVKHESQFDPHAKGDGEASRGLWQISKIYHPEVSDAVAFNVASSTEWSLGRIRSGKVNEWSTYRFCRTLYEDCPF